MDQPASNQQPQPLPSMGGKRRRRRRTRSRRGKRGGSFLNRLIVPGSLLVARTGLPSLRNNKNHDKKTRRRRRSRKN